MEDKSKFFDTEYIRDFLLQRLSQQETRAFMDELRENSELREIVREEKLLFEVFRQGERQELVAKLEAEAEELERKKNIIPLWTKIGMGIAAILVLGFFVSPQYKNRHLYNSFYPDMPESLGATKGGASQSETWIEGRNAYLNMEYETAIQAFESIEPKSKEERGKKALFLGRAYLETGNPNKAIDILSSEESPVAKWHLALAYLRAGNSSKALQQLQQMKGTVYEKRANIFLKKMGENPYFFLYW